MQQPSGAVSPAAMLVAALPNPVPDVPQLNVRLPQGLSAEQLQLVVPCNGEPHTPKPCFALLCPWQSCSAAALP